MPFEIIVSSEKKQKTGAAQEAAEQLGYGDVRVTGFKVPSDINEQPASYEEARRGASNRLQHLLEASDGQPYDLAVSIENGVFPEGPILPLPSLLRRFRNAASIQSGRLVEGRTLPILGRFRRWRHYIDRGVVIVHRPDGSETVSVSYGVEFPRDASEQILDSDDARRTTTVGKLMEKMHPEIDAIDPQDYLTNGRHPRTQILSDAIVHAMQKLELRGRS